MIGKKKSPQRTGLLVMKERQRMMQMNKYMKSAQNQVMTPDQSSGKLSPRVSREDILEATCGGQIIFEDLIDNFKVGKTINSPLRDDDRRASFSTNNRDGKIWFKDHATGTVGDAIAFYQKLRGMDHAEAVKELGCKYLLTYEQPREPRPEPVERPANYFRFSPAAWSDFDRSFWGSYGITEDILNRFGVIRVSEYSRDRHKHTCSEEDPVYLYAYGDRRKIYRPFSKNPRYKWWWPAGKPNGLLFGMEQLPEIGEVVILAAGEKDVMSLAAAGWPAITLNSETDSALGRDREVLTGLKRRFKKVIVAYDRDETGMREASRLSAEMGLYNLQLPEELGGFTHNITGKACKDVSDYMAVFGPEKFAELVPLAAAPVTASGSGNLESDQAAIGARVVKLNARSGNTKFHQAEDYLRERYEFRRNLITELTEYRQRDSDDPFRAIEDESDLYIDMNKEGIRLSLDNLRALLRSSFADKYDPFLEYFDGLAPWTPDEGDHIEQTANFIKLRDRNRFNTQFRKMLVRTIACAMDQAVFNKQIFVLVHFKQNSGKTTFLRWLCPPALQGYYTENVDFNDKDTNIALTENFIINVDELAVMDRTDIRRLKQVLSKDFDKSRRAYGARQIRRARRASFVASTNDLEFLLDQTGNVRWMCFEIDDIDFAYSRKIDIDRLWAQAYHLYKSGERYQLTKQEVEENEAANQNYMVPRPEVEVIVMNFEPIKPEDKEGNYFITASQLGRVLQNHWQIKCSHVVIGRSLTMLGYKRIQGYKSKKEEKSYPVYGYLMGYTGDDLNIKSALSAHIIEKQAKPTF
jgi:hypothetical protein